MRLYCKGALVFVYTDQFDLVYSVVLLGRKMKFNKTKSKINASEHTRTRVRARAHSISTLCRINVCMCVCVKFDVRVETKLAKVVSDFGSNRRHNGTTAPPNLFLHRKLGRGNLCAGFELFCEENEAGERTHTYNK